MFVIQRRRYRTIEETLPVACNRMPRQCTNSLPTLLVARAKEGAVRVAMSFCFCLVIFLFICFLILGDKVKTQTFALELGCKGAL